MMLFACVCVTLSWGCREPLGYPDYSDFADIFATQNVDAGPTLVGPDPYVPGEPRLSLGIFYEGPSSQNMEVDGASSNFYIFISGSNLTLDLEDETLDRVEGEKSDRMTHRGLGWWGSGVIWEPSRDLSEWTTLAVSLKSNDLKEVNITMGTPDKEVGLSAGDYGYAADGEWHHLRVPLADFTDKGVSLADLKVAFALGAAGGTAGDSILVDAVYLE